MIIINLTRPDHLNMPAVRHKQTGIAKIPLNILLQFFFPPGGPRFRQGRVLTAVHVPEASVNKNGDLAPAEYDIRLSGQVFSMQPVS